MLGGLLLRATHLSRSSTTDLTALVYALTAHVLMEDYREFGTSVFCAGRVLCR